MVVLVCERLADEVDALVILPKVLKLCIENEIYGLLLNKEVRQNSLGPVKRVCCNADVVNLSNFLLIKSHLLLKLLLLL